MANRLISTHQQQLKENRHGTVSRCIWPFVTVEDLDAARCFYTSLYPHDHVSEGVFAGINYISVMRDGETLVNIFQKGEGNLLAAIFPTLKVGSVAASKRKSKDSAAAC